MKTALFSHDDCELHDMGCGHPESPARLTAIKNKLQDTRLMQQLDYIRAEEVQRAHVEKVHPGTYIDQLDLMVPEKGRIMADPDTAMMKHSMRAAKLAAGAAVQAVDVVMSGQYDTAFCATRPPGHHAERNKTMGFCFYNNVAIAARHAMDLHGLERVAIIDFDVHQGNGTIDIFQNDPRVMVCSSFQHPHYPNSHYTLLPDNIVNTPMDAYSKGIVFRNKTEKDWLNRLQNHKPQLILISAGFDAHKDDPMADIELQESDYRWVTEMIMDVAKYYADNRVVSVLEGGYNLQALAASVESHLEVLSGC
ncbi:MAG: histone deacetylase family protein [Pseudomonadales bacterium]|uniref:Deacetylase n=1 Tax=Oleiphilus messinensis TaxID=141451 RepID=A0A1Y0I9E5_9GAMM|nr:histone deacetylase family protein [Oleiphilus messinensis]ARU57147.1 deacetylase [Oleiphilus messinensis]MCG8613610.1 histone deacetylase family protein [Pseudomonadales bacterium]